MSHTHEQMEEQAIDLERGILTGRPGSDLYLYRFQHPGSLPEIGRRGDFVCSAGTFSARLVDRRGPEALFCLAADVPLSSSLAGTFLPATPPVPPPALSRGSSEAGPAGTDLFLDPHDGWVMSLTEAAGRKKNAFMAGQWPLSTVAELPNRMSASGITFIWRQRPDPEAAAVAELAQHFRRTGGRVLAAGSAPSDLEPLAQLAGAVFPGPAPESSPLFPVSVHTKIQEAMAARESELNRRRNQMADLKREEAAIKADQNCWDDLDELETRFLTMGREVSRRQKNWDEVRQKLNQARRTWGQASMEADREGQGLLNWLRKGRAREKALKSQAQAQSALETAEAAMSAVRREEEKTVEEALGLEQRLARTRREAKDWPCREELAAKLANLKSRESEAADLLSAVLARPLPGADDIMAEAEVVLALTADLSAGEALSGRHFDHVLALISRPPDSVGRSALASLVLTAEKTLTVWGDFTHWPIWGGRPPLMEDRGPAWTGLTLKEETDPLSLFLAEGGLFEPDRPRPIGSPDLRRLELTGAADEPETVTFKYIVPPSGRTPEASEDWPDLPGSLSGKPGRNNETISYTCGLGLRAVGDIGPANPVSGLMVARAAVNFSHSRPGSGTAVYILTASTSHALMINKMLADLGCPAGRVMAGEPTDFPDWPKAPLVILEPAFEAPHLSHPWAWPSFGRQRLALAWTLAEEQIWLTGRGDWLNRLPESSPLAALWKRTAGQPAYADLEDPKKEAHLNFWEALDRARSEVWAILPVFEGFWWRPLEEHFLSAARRRARVTILCAPPGPDSDKEEAGKAIKTLSACGCSVHLAAGFPGFMALVDGIHFTWGNIVTGVKGAHIWGGLKSVALPEAAPLISEILQLDLINDKMGRRSGGLKNCRKCGWPLVLINQEQARGFSDEQPLKIGCLGGCRGSRAVRRLDEREPFLAPPKCRVDRITFYRRRWRGRQETWLCPNHPDGDSCPAYRVVSGDTK